MAPRQKPGKSRQDYSTPPELLIAIKHRLAIDAFALDVAATNENKVAPRWYTPEDDALSNVSPWFSRGWAWCNPPYGNIAPWVMKATMEARLGAHVMVLVPSSVGSDWWADWVEPFAYVTHLHGRITFVGCKDAYPKDCSLLMYTPWAMTGHETWDWR